MSRPNVTLMEPYLNPPPNDSPERYHISGPVLRAEIKLYREQDEVIPFSPEGRARGSERLH